MTETKPDAASLVSRLEQAALVARDSTDLAEEHMEARNQLVLQAAESGVSYKRIAQALGITVDGVTYVLRRMRRRP